MQSTIVGHEVAKAVAAIAEKRTSAAARRGSRKIVLRVFDKNKTHHAKGTDCGGDQRGVDLTAENSRRTWGVPLEMEPQFLGRLRGPDQ